MAAGVEDKIADKIIDCIVLGSGGRLLAVKPEDTKIGADLVIKRKGEYKSKKEIYLVINGQAAGVKKNFYLMFVSFDIIKQDIDEKVRILKLDGTKKEFLINKKDLSQFFLNLV